MPDATEIKREFLDIQLGTLAGGPHWDNFDICPAEDYVCTFECIDTFGPDRKLTTWICDLYVTQVGGHGQSYVLRMDEDWAGSYHSGPLDALFNVAHKPWSQALYILRELGRFTWTCGSASA